MMLTVEEASNLLLVVDIADGEGIIVGTTRTLESNALQQVEILY